MFIIEDLKGRKELSAWILHAPVEGLGLRCEGGGGGELVYTSSRFQYAKYNLKLIVFLPASPELKLSYLKVKSFKVQPRCYFVCNLTNASSGLIDSWDSQNWDYCSAVHWRCVL